MWHAPNADVGRPELKLAKPKRPGQSVVVLCLNFTARTVFGKLALVLPVIYHRD